MLFYTLFMQKVSFLTDKSYLQGDEWCKDAAHITEILVSCTGI
jgi:hypothetical protein